MQNTCKPSTLNLASPRYSALRRWAPALTFAVLALASVASAQTAGFATTEITTPIKNLVVIANATIAGLAVLAVIYFAVRAIGGDDGAVKKIITVIILAVVALGAANFLGWVTGKADFDAVTMRTLEGMVARV